MRNQVWSYTNQANGHLTRITDPEGHTTRIDRLDPEGNAIRITEADGFVRDYTRQTKDSGQYAEVTETRSDNTQIKTWYGKQADFQPMAVPGLGNQSPMGPTLSRCRVQTMN